MTQPTNDQTQVPPEGSAGQAQNDQAPSAGELKQRLDTLQAELLKKEREAKSNQARADRAEQRLTETLSARKTPLPVARTSTRTVPQALQQPQQQAEQPPASETLETVVAEQQKELLLLREMARRGLTEEDVEGIEFKDASDLNIQLEIRQQRKEIEDLRKRLATGGEQSQQSSSSPVQIDTGGRTGGGASDRTLQRVQSFRDNAAKLKKEGRHKEAAWQALRAAHLDPAKRIPIRPSESEE